MVAIDQALATAVLLVLCTCAAPLAGSQPRQVAAREDLVARLRHQEALVSSLQCEYEFTRCPPAPEMIQLLKEFCASHRVPPASNYSLDSKSFLHIHLLRKGIKERSESFDNGRTAAPSSVTAFDGQIVRSLAEDGGALIGSIENTDQANWGIANHLQPYSLIYEYARTPYSKLVSDGVDYHASPARLGTVNVTEVTFRHPGTEWLSFRLFFNEEGQLVQRAIVAKMAWDRAPRVYETHQLREYEQFALPSGEAITFPRQAAYHYHVGSTDDGTMIDWMVETLNIEKVAFNVPIPDSEFTLVFPKEAKVSDRVLGIDTGSPDRSDSPSDAPLRFSTTWRIILAVNGAILLAAAALVIARRQRKRSGSPT